MHHLDNAPLSSLKEDFCLNSRKNNIEYINLCGVYNIPSLSIMKLKEIA